MKIINGLKFHTMEEVFAKSMKSKTFRDAYKAEIARLHLVCQIRELRKSKKLTQKTLALRAKMPQSVIARIESGEHSFSLGTLTKIALVFNKEVQLS